MSGNVAEWMLDYYAGGYAGNCMDCLNATATTSRSYRGGGYLLNDYAALVSTRDGFEPSATRSFIGFRCARDLE